MANLGESSSSTTQTTNTQVLLPPHNSALAQMSFGPATQQTVTTVTTTTTIALPPLIMKPPKHLFDRDPKQYPLAFSPTPQSLKRFAFDLNGRPTTFHEVEDPVETVKRLQKMQARLQKNNGVIRREDTREVHTPVRDGRPYTRQSRMVDGQRSSAVTKRTAGPAAFVDATELAGFQRRSKKPRAHLHRSQSEQVEHPSLNQRAAAGMFPALGNPSPVTPDVEVTLPDLPPQPDTSFGRRRQIPSRLSQSRLQQLQDTDDDDEQDLAFRAGPAGPALLEDEAPLGPPLYARRERKRKAYGERSVSVETRPETVTTTPPIGENEFDMTGPTPHEYRRPALPNIVTVPQQDASLPSPSLSPITAAANLRSRNQNVFERSFADQHEESASTMSGFDLDEDGQFHNPKSTDSQELSQMDEDATAPAITSFGQGQPTSNLSGTVPPTVMDIPTMVDAFDSMPEAMQTYLIYQFLRRCGKSTLQVVANVVNPALKCDPFTILPPELSLNITRYLDAQSMCRAAQVSKKWRKLISSDERAWKDLLDRDEFVLPKDEIARAVREGWGWQHPGEDDYERDLSRHVLAPTPERVTSAADVLTNILSDDEVTSSTVTSRSRRRSTMKSSSSKKTRRRGALSSSSSLISKPGSSSSSGSATWRRLLASAQGPMAFANAAAQAIPHPSIGLSSLKNMHLFKSLYQRHYLVRRAWMHDEPHSQPLHLAFRAHHRHVVTCLLFDSDKILTGSDDTKINVYDTKTGALRNRLEGHEGGVWALQYEGDTLVSGSTDRSVRVWDIKTGRCLQVFQGHTSTVRCLVILQPVQIGTELDGTPIIMPKEPLIITGSRDSTLRVWKLPKPNDPQIYQSGPPTNDRDNPYFLRTLAGHHNSVRAIAAHGDTLVSGSYDCSVRVWKISTGDLVHRLQGHGQKVYSVVLDHARNRCISGSMDHLVKVWDLQTGACLYNLEGHTSLVGLLDLSHDRLVSAAADSTLRIWDPETGTCKATLSAHTGAITCFQHDGQKVISGSDRTLKMWNVKNGECVRDLLTDLSGVWQVRFDQRRCVAAVQRKSLTYIEVLDFGAARDGVPADRRGRRVVVDCRGREIEDVEVSGTMLEPEIAVGVEV